MEGQAVGGNGTAEIRRTRIPEGKSDKGKGLGCQFESGRGGDGVLTRGVGESKMGKVSKQGPDGPGKD